MTTSTRRTIASNCVDGLIGSGRIDFKAPKRQQADYAFFKTFRFVEILFPNMKDRTLW